MVFRHHSKEIKERALFLLREGYEIEAIVDALDVSAKSIQRWQENLESEGTVNPTRYYPGRPRKLTREAVDAVDSLIAEDPDAYLDEIAEHLAIYHNMDIPLSTLSHNILELNLTRKRMKRVAAERDDAERAQWFDTFMQTYLPEQTIFIDESAKDGCTLARRYGRSRSGVNAEGLAPLHRGKRYSILPALDVNGYFALRIVEGSVDSDEFLDFVLHDVLPSMQPYPNTRSVLIMDNCAIHKSDALRDIVEGYGCRLVFLPPYSPDFNPIEESFSCVKAYLRRHWRNFEDSEFPELELELACYDAVTPEKARGWYSDCGYLDHQ